MPCMPGNRKQSPSKMYSESTPLGGARIIRLNILTIKAVMLWNGAVAALYKYIGCHTLASLFPYISIRLAVATVTDRPPPGVAGS